MKKTLLNFVFIVCLALTVTSCYTNTQIIGNGPQSGIEVKKANHYFIYGLAQGSQANPQEMAGDAKDYQIVITHSFVDGLLNALTFGIYTPTTTIVTK